MNKYEKQNNPHNLSYTNEIDTDFFVTGKESRVAQVFILVVVILSGHWR